MHTNDDDTETINTESYYTADIIEDESVLGIDIISESNLFEVSDFIKQIPILKNERILCKGSIQSGKTSNIISLALYRMQDGYDVLIVSNLIKDCKQVKKRFDDVFEMNQLDPDDYIVNMYEDKNKLKHTVTPYIYNINSHVSKLKKFINFYTAQTYKKLYLIIDEADLYNSQIDVEYTSQTRHNIIELIKMADGFCSFTATAYAYTHLDDVYPLKCKNMYFIPKSQYYVSLGSPNFRIIIMSQDLYIKSGERWTRAKECMFEKIIKNEKEICKVPITIVNVGIEIQAHNYIKNLILEKYPKYTVIMLNESSCTMYHHNRVHSFNMLQEALSKVQKHINSHDYVFIISCKQLARGTSPRSEVVDFTNINQIVYATSIIYCCSDTKSTDEIEQNILRISGNFPRNLEEKFEIRAYTTDKISKILKIQNHHNEKNEEKIKDPINAEKLVTEVIVPIKSDKPIHMMVSKTTGHFTQKEYEKNGYKYYEVTKNRIKIKEQKNKNTSDNDDEDISNIITQRLKKNNDIISKFCCNLDPNTSYTKDELQDIYNVTIKELGIKLKDFSHFFLHLFRKNKNGGYGILFDKINNNYVIKNKYKKLWSNY
jgi:hypothetical protein